MRIRHSPGKHILKCIRLKRLTSQADQKIPANARSESLPISRTFHCHNVGIFVLYTSKLIDTPSYWWFHLDSFQLKLNIDRYVVIDLQRTVCVLERKFEKSGKVYYWFTDWFRERSTAGADP